MSNIKKSLDDIFEVPQPVITEVLDDEISISPPTVIGTPQEARPISSSYYTEERPEEVENQDEDFRKARKNIRNIVDQGDTILKGIMEVARDTDKPSAYEAAALIMKTLMDANKDLIDIHEKNKKFKALPESNLPVNNGDINVNNAVFVGNATDLLKKIREAKED